MIDSPRFRSCLRLSDNTVRVTSVASVIDESLVRHIAQLARLTMDDAEVRSMAIELTAIVGYFDQLRALPTDGVTPTAHPLAIQNVFRDDEISESYAPETALRNAPAQRDGFFCVPKVLDGGGDT